MNAFQDIFHILPRFIELRSSPSPSCTSELIYSVVFYSSSFFSFFLFFLFFLSSAYSFYSTYSLLSSFSPNKLYSFSSHSWISCIYLLFYYFCKAIYSSFPYCTLMKSSLNWMKQYSSTNILVLSFRHGMHSGFTHEYIIKVSQSTSINSVKALNIWGITWSSNILGCLHKGH